MEINAKYCISIRIAALIGLLFFYTCETLQAAGMEVNDTLSLHEVTVEAVHQAPAYISTTGNVAIRPDALLGGLRTMGEADIVYHLKSLPGFSAVGDLSSGLSINGCDYSQTGFEVDGATVFFPYHIGGVFSTFNTPHFEISTAGAWRPKVTSPSRIGGYVSMISDVHHGDSLSGSVNFGVISSAVTVKLPVPKARQIFIASVRRSYINLLFGKLLNSDDITVKYDFTDANFAWRWSPSRRVSMQVSALLNADNLLYLQRDASLDTRLHWRNTALSGSLTFSSDDVAYNQTFTWSSFTNKLMVDLSQLAMKVPSSVSQFGATGELSLVKKHLDLGYRIEVSRFNPQYVSSHGFITTKPHAAEVYDMQMYSLTAAYRYRVLPCLQLSPSVRAEIDHADSRNFYAVNPLLTSIVFWGGNTVSLTLGTSTQNIHQVGFSDLGMSSNFWLPVSQRLHPQHSLDASLMYTGESGRQHLRWSATAFSKRIHNDAEYDGSVLDLISDDYNAMTRTYSTSGYNYGCDLTLSYDAQPLSGHITYGYHRSMRRKEGETSYHPSPYEIRNSLKVFLQWKITPRIETSAFFSYATGRPYTPVKALYLMAGNLISVYANRNSANLPAYHRLDLSVTYHFRPLHIAHRSIDNFLNFTLLNAYGHKNVESQYYIFDSRNKTFRMTRVFSLYRFLPSLSYTVKF